MADARASSRAVRITSSVHVLAILPALVFGHRAHRRAVLILQVRFVFRGVEAAETE